MKTRRVVLITVLCTLLLVSLLGAGSAVHKKQDRNIAKEIVLRFSESDDLSDLGQYSGENRIYRDLYAGCYAFSDQRYLYFVDVDEQFLNAVCVQTETDADAIVIEDADAAAEFFRKNYAEFRGELAVDTSGNDAQGYTYTITESMWGIDTGSDASVSVDAEGRLVAAAFHKADYSAFPEDIDKLLKEDEALALACEEIMNGLGDAAKIRLLPEQAEGRRRVWKGRVQWVLTIPAEDMQYPEEEMPNKQYQALIDAESGEIIEIAESL